MTIKPEIRNYVVERTKELGKIDRDGLISEVKIKFNTIISERSIYNILKGIVFSEKKTPNEVQDSVSELQGFLDSRGITIKDLNDFFYHQETRNQAEHKINILGATETFKIGVVSDTHLGAKSCALSELHDFYDLCKKEGVTDVLHAGDLCDGGGKVYPGQLGELVVFGFDDMLQYVQDNYPKRKGITTHFILGNHDEDFLKHGGANIGKAIASVREDLNYLGFYDATVIVNGIKFGLHHGGGGASYAQSYKLQKAVETLTGDMKPQVYILGHYHGALYMAMRNIHCFLPGCFQKSNNFSVRFNLPNIVGGYILEIHKTKRDEVRRIKPEFIQYYF